MNGEAMAAFMEGFQRTKALMDQQRLQRDELSMRRDDRQQVLTRQSEQDRIAAEDRARQATERERAMALQGMQVPGNLAELGGTASDPSEAQRLIESMMPAVLKAFGPEALAYGQPAVEMATRTITARQKKDVERFVEQALKTSFIADNPDADPEITSLPEHIQRAVGKPSAKLSELQQFASLPVGKPPGRTRTPAAAGSFEDYVQRKYGDAATPEQILEARKAYQQSDDRPTVNVTLPGGISGKAGDAALKFQDDYARDSKPYITLRDAYQRVKAAAPDAAGDLSLIFAYMKILDPNSVVREQEFANAQNATGVPDRIRNLYNRVKEGTRLNPEQRRQFQSQAAALFRNAQQNQQQVRNTYRRRAKQWGIPESMVLDEEDQMLTDQGPPPAPDAPAATGPKVGERRKVRGVLAEWDGQGWLPVR